MIILLPNGLEIIVRLIHRLSLFAAHSKGFVMRTGEPFSRAQFGKRGLYVFHRTAHPLQFGIFKALCNKNRPHFVVRKDRAVIALG